MSIQDEALVDNDFPVLELDLDYDNWYFLAPDGTELIGPYTSWERAVEKYHEYCAYTIYAPGCHCRPRN